MNDEDESRVCLRNSEVRCICGWHVAFMLTGTEADRQARADLIFEGHVQSGDCPEERDELGCIVHRDEVGNIV